ncbi:MAG TPA: EF-hand domain-containing protein [Polyangiaceae bacterium]|nr:EF-hand domain-containing protein [Polyangiaceae bacterium]
MENSALRARFDRCDKDGNGRIDLTEFAALLSALGLGYEEAQVQAAFTALDKDQDGQIDFAEFSKWWLGG